MAWTDNLKVPGTEAIVDKLGAATDVAAVAVDKLLELLDEYEKALSLLSKYGFKVGTFAVGGFPPEAKTSIEGSISDLPKDEISALAESHKGEKVVTLLLNALLVAKRVHERVKLGFESISLHLTLGLKPSIDWEFH